MWKFNPNEKNDMPEEAIVQNTAFIQPYKIVTPNMIERYTRFNIFPGLQALYEVAPHWIIQAQLGRLLYIYFNGGLYCDTDCFIRKNIDVTKHAISLFTEHVCTSVDELGEREKKHPDNLVRVASYCFGASTRQHPFLKKVIEECLQRMTQLLVTENKTDLNHQDLLWVCGPDALTTVYHETKHLHNNVHLYDMTYLDHVCYGSWR
jgi:hypothetical protein